MTNNIYVRNLETDFEAFFGMLLQEKEMNRAILEPKYKVIHESIYNFKELINICTNENTDAQSFLIETLTGLIDVTDFLSKNRYKLASSILRNSLETFAKYLVYQNKLDDKEGFTNNFEISLKHLRTQYASQFVVRTSKKNFNKLINDTYLNPLKQIYWELCDIVHAKDITYNECQDYLENIRKSNFDSLKFEKVFTFIISSLNKMTAIFYLQNANFLLNNANQVKLDYLLSRLDDEFKKVREYV